jgi:3-oxoacyl-[acyl-carrier protein] reductase
MPKERNVIVTGGSRGIGLAIARRLVRAGYRVISLARKSNPELESALAEANQLTPGSLQFLSCDLSEIESFSQLVKSIRNDFGPIYGLVNNAGMSVDGVLALTSTSQIEQIVRLNTVSPMVLSKFVTRAMMAEGGGRIVNLASIIAFTGYSGLSVYGATKASIIGFTRSLAREVGRAGITVNAVAPGFVDTDMTQGLSAEDRERIARRSALRRLVDVDDVAASVEFLLSDAAKSITGTVITVDAGNTA